MDVDVVDGFIKELGSHQNASVVSNATVDRVEKHTSKQMRTTRYAHPRKVAILLCAQGIELTSTSIPPFHDS